MSNRMWLLAAALIAALTLAAPAAAAPRHYKVLAKARHHLGKPAHKQLIAVRHGHHIHWFSKTHGLAKTKLPPIKLSANVSFAHGIRAFGPTSPPTVTGVGSCNFDPLVIARRHQLRSVLRELLADVLTCVGNNGGNTESNAFFPSPSCDNGAPQSDHESPVILATFVDGEWMALCTVPDDNGSGGSQANDQHAPYVVYQQGFPCRPRSGPDRTATPPGSLRPTTRWSTSRPTPRTVRTPRR